MTQCHLMRICKSISSMETKILYCKALTVFATDRGILLVLIYKRGIGYRSTTITAHHNPSLITVAQTATFKMDIFDEQSDRLFTL